MRCEDFPGHFADRPPLPQYVFIMHILLVFNQLLIIKNEGVVSLLDIDRFQKFIYCIFSKKLTKQLLMI